MKPQNSFRHCLALFLAVLLVAANTYAEVVVVVSAKSTITNLTSDQVTKIFLGKTDTFPNGKNALPIDQVEGSSIRNDFYARVANKSPSQMSAYWTKIIFTGDGYPPKQLEGNLSVKKTIANNPNAIGYVDSTFHYMG